MNSFAAMAEISEKEDSLGCEHYRRKCAFLSPCCKKVYTCRLCHDEKEVHEIDRKAVQEVKCLTCGTQQPVQKSCGNCETVFGNYFCSICRLFDDVDKQQFHCDDCGICRVGGRETYFHCKVCNMCLSIGLKEEHRCIENMSHANCAVCMEDLHSSRAALTMPPCSHLIHKDCYYNLLKKGIYACPTCNQSMIDMKEAWELLDEEMANTVMPEEYRNMKINILCRDCHKECTVLFHVVGSKCEHCGSYNTCGADGPN